MAILGDDLLFLGPRPLRLGGGKFTIETTDAVMKEVLAEEKLAPSLCNTGSTHISRVHGTRIEVNVNVDEVELSTACSDDRITDVVIISETDAIDSLFDVRRILKVLNDVPQVNAIRLRSRKFNYEPQNYSAGVIDCLASFNKLGLVNPKRLEIETQFLVPDEFTAEHGRIAGLLSNRGITVYNNTPLLGRINDTPESIHLLAYNYLQTRIEFHHLYIAGAPLQNLWNVDNLVALYDVVDIATRVRCEGSGREVPRYIIRTAAGEADFGLATEISGEGEDLTIKLLPYDLQYYKNISPDFTWPEGVGEAGDSHPITEITGLVKTSDFPLS